MAKGSVGKSLAAGWAAFFEAAALLLAQAPAASPVDRAKLETLHEAGKAFQQALADPNATIESVADLRQKLEHETGRFAGRESGPEEKRIVDLYASAARAYQDARNRFGADRSREHYLADMKQIQTELVEADNLYQGGAPILPAVAPPLPPPPPPARPKTPPAKTVPVPPSDLAPPPPAPPPMPPAHSPEPPTHATPPTKRPPPPVSPPPPTVNTAPPETAPPAEPRTTPSAPPTAAPPTAPPTTAPPPTTPSAPAAPPVAPVPPAPEVQPPSVTNPPPPPAAASEVSPAPPAAPPPAPQTPPAPASVPPSGNPPPPPANVPPPPAALAPAPAPPPPAVVPTPAPPAAEVPPPEPTGPRHGPPIVSRGPVPTTPSGVRKAADKLRIETNTAAVVDRCALLGEVTTGDVRQGVYEIGGHNFLYEDALGLARLKTVEAGGDTFLVRARTKRSITGDAYRCSQPK